MSYENPWVYNGNVVDSELLDNYLGFVYNITNLTNGRQYIGKKLLKRTKTKKVKGKKKKTLVESDWKEYYGSNKTLGEHVCLFGENKFIREIIHLCYTKGEMTYYETKHIFATDAILSNKYYNDWCMMRVRRNHVIKE